MCACGQLFMHAGLVRRKITRGFRLQSQLTIAKGLFVKRESIANETARGETAKLFYDDQIRVSARLIRGIRYDVNQSDETCTDARNARRYDLNTPRVPTRTYA